MDERRRLERGMLGLAVLWTVLTAVWAVVFFTWLALREFVPAAMGAIGAAALAVCAVFCVLWWRRYRNMKRANKTEHRGGNDHV